MTQCVEVLCVIADVRGMDVAAAVFGVKLPGSYSCQYSGLSRDAAQLTWPCSVPVTLVFSA